MAVEVPGFVLGILNANADLSAKQYHCMKLANNSGVAEVAVCTAAGEKIIGILQDKPSAQGAVATLVTQGVTKASAGAAITAGALVMTDANGQVITAATAGSTIIGWALESAGGANELVTIMLQPAYGVV